MKVLANGECPKASPTECLEYKGCHEEDFGDCRTEDEDAMLTMSRISCLSKSNNQPILSMLRGDDCLLLNSGIGMATKMANGMGVASDHLGHYVQA